MFSSFHQFSATKSVKVWMVVPFDVISVADIVTLHLLISIIQHDNGSNKVDDFTSWQQIDITPGITAAIAVAKHR